MDEKKIDNKYIIRALHDIVEAVGIKEPIEESKISHPGDYRGIKECTRDIARYLGLPVEVYFEFVTKDDFSTEMFGGSVSSGVHGSIDGVAAQVQIPASLPFYGSTGMINFPIHIKISKESVRRPLSFKAVVSHELSHIVLHSLRHPQKESEIYTDLTAMVLGFADVMGRGRKHSINTYSPEGFGVRTTTYGYLPDQQFECAKRKIEMALKKLRKLKNKVSIRAKKNEKFNKNNKNNLLDLKKSIEDLKVTEGSKRMSSSLGLKMVEMHRLDYFHTFEDDIEKNQSKIEEIKTFVTDLKHYNKKTEETLLDHLAFLKRQRSVLKKTFSQLGTDKRSVALVKGYLSYAGELLQFSLQKLIIFSLYIR